MARPEAKPAVPARGSTVGLPKTLEDVRQELRGNTDAAVADDDLGVRFPPTERPAPECVRLAA